MFAHQPFYTPSSSASSSSSPSSVVSNAISIDLSKLSAAGLEKLALDVQAEIAARQREVLRQQETAQIHSEMNALKNELLQLRGEVSRNIQQPQQQEQQPQAQAQAQPLQQSNAWHAQTRTSLPPLVPTRKPKAKAAKPVSAPSTQYCKPRTSKDGHPYWQICPDDNCGCQHYPTGNDDPSQPCPLLDTKALHLSYLQQKGDKPDREELEKRISQALGEEAMYTENGLKFMADLCSANIYFADHATASRAQELLMEATNYGVNFRRLPTSRK